MEQMSNRGKCACPHHKLGPLVIIVLGLIWLFNELGALSWHTTSIILALLVICIGFKKMVMGKCGCCGKKCEGCKCEGGKCENKPPETPNK
jgi:hypothetical protein